MRHAAALCPPTDRDASSERLPPLERRIVAMAARDTLASIRPVSRPRLLLARLFGLRGANRLADPRLETLRAYAVRCWRGVPGASSRHAHEVAACGYRPALVLREIGAPAIAGGAA